MRLVNDENESEPRTSSGSSGSVNRVMAVGKGAKIWFEGNVYSLRKKPNPDKGIKYAYWDCAHSGCRVTARTSGVDSLEGFTYGRTQSHSHTDFTCGEIIHMEMLEKAKLRARSQTESIGKIVASVPQAIWNIYDRDDDDRTNNCCECWHSKWNRSSGAPHPHIWR